jgi:hypothetical protein
MRIRHGMHLAIFDKPAHWQASSAPRSNQSRLWSLSGYEEALSIIGKHRGLVTAMVSALITHPERTLDAAEIDAVITQTLAHEAMAAERARRIAWREATETRRGYQVVAEIEMQPRHRRWTCRAVA